MNQDLRFKVNLTGIIELLSKHIYKTEDVFLRELLQNGTDAITARQKINDSFNAKITLELFRGEDYSTLAFTDNGIGLTEQDIHQFIATIGESSKKMTQGVISDFIGHFGIGLLSCFMVSDKIVMISRHVNESKGYKWEGLPDGTYHIESIQEDVPVGTSVYLTCAKGKEEMFEFNKLKQILTYYGNLLPFEICIKENEQELVINESTPPWFESFTELDKTDVITYGQNLFQDYFLDAFPIESKTGGAKGVAYVLGRKANYTTKQMSHIYLQRMFLSETSKDILPNWAFFIRVIINSNKLTPTASREEFYDNETLSITREEIGESIKKYLMALPKYNPQLFNSFLNIHGLTLKSLAVDDDDLFRLFLPKLKFETSLGEMTGEQMMNFDKNISFASSLDEFRQTSAVYASQRKLLVNGGYVYDADLLKKIEQIYPEYTIQVAQTQDLLEIMESPSIELQNEILPIISIMDECLQQFDCKAELKLFEPKELPTLISSSENFGFYKNIKNVKDESNEIFSSILDNFTDDFSSKGILCFNLNNKIVQKIITLKRKEDIQFITKMLYCQSMIMGHYPLQKGEMQILNNGLLQLLASVFAIE